MAFLSLGLFLMVLFHGCTAQFSPHQNQWQALGGAQRHRLQARTSCDIDRISAREPNRRFSAEAGETEIWDLENEEFLCAGFVAIRYTIQPRGLLLPSYTNAPQISYVIRGKGIQGAVIPGCAETFESSQESGFPDRHQKVREIRQGDVLSVFPGMTTWAFNNGENPLELISLLDLSNDANQLDLKIRKFFLAGNPSAARGEERHGAQTKEAGNVFKGIDEKFLSAIFNVDVDTARKLKGDEDNRGNIVRVEKNFEVVCPSYQGEEAEMRERRHNGLEETVCTMKLSQNIDSARRADVYNPRGGRLTTLNSHHFPALNTIQLSAERGVLYRNAILAPYWNVNAHSMVYILRGSGRMQIVGSKGTVFDEQVKEGQIVVVPQDFASIKKASQDGLEWIAFKTSANAMTSPIAGRLSVFRGLPVDVLMNSYGISREEARNMKFNREGLKVFGPGSATRS
ncbi:13S globulin seed storage protein 1-like [Impatiens glandulifera]|uniref:13S globulin seed storage protein 1-like n=1 Tax=Impatiens glandulifera TaxID=253017 RepID=UPI001FB08536|nr:13S globulin seed storage protein 1-like [Impatiens glandulifera]